MMHAQRAGPASSKLIWPQAQLPDVTSVLVARAGVSEPLRAPLGWIGLVLRQPVVDLRDGSPGAHEQVHLRPDAELTLERARRHEHLLRVVFYGGHLRPAH